MKYQSGKKSNGEILGFKTLIKPSDESVKRHYAQLAEVIDKHKSATQEALISKLNPKIRGWCNYYKTVCSKETYSKLYHRLFWKLMRWGFRRHPKQSKRWVVDKYWKTVGNDNWVFGEKGVSTLIQHPQTAIKRHTKVRGDTSPYDGNKTYWATRKGTHPELKDSIARLLKKQKGKCNWCELIFQDGEKIEKDHITLKVIVGNIKDNLQLLHKHCHDEKTKDDLKAIERHRAIKNYQKFIKRFNKTNWKWIDDIPTLVGTHKKPERREAV